MDENEAPSNAYTLDSLPIDVLKLVLVSLGPREVMRTSKSCSLLHAVGLSNTAWQARVDDARAAATDVADGMLPAVAVFSEKHEMETLEAMKEAAPGIALAKQEGKRRGAKYVYAPYEKEYMAHAAAHAQASKSVKQLENALYKTCEENIKVSAEQPGSFLASFLETMDSCNCHRQAHFSGALNGNDAETALKPDSIVAFTNLLRPRKFRKHWRSDGTFEVEELSQGVELYDMHTYINATHLPTSPSDPDVITIGSHETADLYAELLSSFGACKSLFARKTPLCEHLIEAYGPLRERFAITYAKAHPRDAPTPKVYGVLYQVWAQMKWLGGTGIMHEGVVKASHCVDNRFATRYANVRNLEQQLLCRARAAWQLSDPSGAKSIRAPDDARERRKCDRMSVGSRAKRAKHEIRDGMQYGGK